MSERQAINAMKTEDIIKIGDEGTNDIEKKPELQETRNKTSKAGKPHASGWFVEE